VTPLGRVLAGHGNNGKDDFEGVRDRNLIGTYLHGPLLPKNSWLADHLILTGLRRRYDEELVLSTLDDGLETAAHQTALDVALKPD
jgi:CobQ-like glutamine amidotransferase family enzyme